MFRVFRFCVLCTVRWFSASLTLIHPPHPLGSCLFCNIRRGVHSSFLKAGSACFLILLMRLFLTSVTSFMRTRSETLWVWANKCAKGYRKKNGNSLIARSCRKLCDAPRPAYVAQPQRLRLLRIRQQRASSDLLLLHDGGQRAGAKLPSTGEFIHSEFDLSISIGSIPVHKTQY